VCDRPVTQDYDLGLVPTLGIGLHLCVPKTPSAFDRLKESPNVSA
jgi:hypothetical protein